MWKQTSSEEVSWEMAFPPQTDPVFMRESHPGAARKGLSEDERRHDTRPIRLSRSSARRTLLLARARRSPRSARFWRSPNSEPHERTCVDMDTFEGGRSRVSCQLVPIATGLLLPTEVGNSPINGFLHLFGVDRLPSFRGLLCPAKRHKRHHRYTYHQAQPRCKCHRSRPPDKNFPPTLNSLEFRSWSGNSDRSI